MIRRPGVFSATRKVVRDTWSDAAVRAGMATARLSQRVGAGGGSIIGGRVTLALDPGALTRLASGREIVLVSGTNGKTTTSHLLAAAMRSTGSVAHNASGSNMPDGAVAALAQDRDARFAVIEVDELYLAAVADAVDPAVIVLLNLSRDQLDRGAEVRSVAAALSAALLRRPRMTVVANADDPMVVWAAAPAHRVTWVSVGSGWSSDTMTCPRCGRSLDTTVKRWRCGCGLARPTASWTARDGAVHTTEGRVAVRLRLPGAFNLGNAVMAIAAAAELGVDPHQAAAAVADIEQIAGRYKIIRHGRHEVRLLLAKNPAGWAETIGLLDEAKALLVVVNARDADGRDTSWLWDVGFEDLRSAAVMACGERAADLGLRLSYADIPHTTVEDPLAALHLLPPGKVDIVANYTAFHQLRRRIGRGIG
jgi:UDP-N-acetylmuramyl tripeptide synthase